MSNSDGGGNDCIYGFPNQSNKDRHIQNIIDHAQTLFTEPSFTNPRFNSTHVTETTGDAHYLNPVGDDQLLDDFGELKSNSFRNVLC
jgi:hypothetical protein